MLRKYDTPHLTDWLAISARWLMLISLFIVLGGGLKVSTLLPLVFLILLNLATSTVAGLNLRVKYYRPVNLVIDFILMAVFYWLQGNLQGPAYWAGLLPILTGAIYFEVPGAFATSLLFSALMLYIGFKLEGDFLSAAPVSIALIVIGLISGFISRDIIARMKKNRELWRDSEEKRNAMQAERMRAIYELTTALSSTLSYKRVLESALNMSVAALNPDPDQLLTDPLVGAVLLFSGGKLRVGSARRFTTPDMRATFDAAEGALKKTLEEGEPLFFTDVAKDPELRRVVAFRNCTSGYCFPLRSGLDVYGAILFAHPEADYFNKERQDVLDIIGRQAVIAIQNARLYQDLVEEKEHMVEVHEEARKKLARDLHDGPTQSVAAIAMRLNILRRLLAKDVNAASEEISKLEDLAHRTTKEIRHMLFTLRPLILESQGLAAAIQSTADKMQETFGQKVTHNIDERVTTQLEMGKQGVIFYIVEEAVNNARKHASAETIHVNLHQMDTDIAILEITDNGLGFDVKAMTQEYEKRANSSLGMVNLRERAELVNGLFQIESAPGKGTKIQVYIPLTEEGTDRLHHPRAK